MGLPAFLPQFLGNVTNATNATPIVISLDRPHGFVAPPANPGGIAGAVWVQGVGGNLRANGAWPVVVIDAVTLQLVGTSAWAAYTSGGTITTPVPPNPPLPDAAGSGLVGVVSTDTGKVMGEIVSCLANPAPPATGDPSGTPGFPYGVRRAEWLFTTIYQRIKQLDPQAYPYP